MAPIMPGERLVNVVFGNVPSEAMPMVATKEEAQTSSQVVKWRLTFDFFIVHVCTCNASFWCGTTARSDRVGNENLQKGIKSQAYDHNERAKGRNVSTTSISRIHPLWITILD